MPGRVIEIVDPEKRIGRVEVFGTPRLINLGMLEEVHPGEWVLVRVGFAIEKIDESTAQETIRLFEEMEASFEDLLAPAVEEEAER